MVATMEQALRLPPQRALPRTCRPAPDETTGSYLLRLAAVNRVTGPDLISYLTGMSQSIAKVTLAALATVGNAPVTSWHEPAVEVSPTFAHSRYEHRASLAMDMGNRTARCDNSPACPPYQ